MRFATVTELKTHATSMVTEVDREKNLIVITKRGKPVALLSSLNIREFKYPHTAPRSWKMPKRWPKEK